MHEHATGRRPTNRALLGIGALGAMILIGGGILAYRGLIALDKLSKTKP